jgi:hypothetical protein
LRQAQFESEFFFLNIFFGVLHSATLIFVIFRFYVIASIAYIHPVYSAGV